MIQVLKRLVRTSALGPGPGSVSRGSQRYLQGFLVRKCSMGRLEGCSWLRRTWVQLLGCEVAGQKLRIQSVLQKVNFAAAIQIKLFSYFSISWFFLFWGGLGSVFNIVPVLCIISDLWICASDTEPQREAPAENNEADFLVIKDKKQKVNFETRPVGRWISGVAKSS